MKKLGLTTVMLLCLCCGAQAQWHDDFDSYSAGGLIGQSDWEGYDFSNFDAEVSNAERFTKDYSVLLLRTTDVVYNFFRIPGGVPTSGTWIFTTKTFVPPGSSGTSRLLLDNDYNVSGSKNVSVKVKFAASTGNVINHSGETLPLITGEWVSLQICIDLDNDRVDIFYGGDLLAGNKSWKDGVTGGGVSAIDTLHLSGSGMNKIYFDDFRLEEMYGPGTRLLATPNPTVAGDTLVFEVDSPTLPSGRRGALFTWAVNGNPYKSRLLSFKLGAGGHWDQSFTVPAGLAGLEVGLKAFVLPSGAPIALSNEELILFQ